MSETILGALVLVTAITVAVILVHTFSRRSAPIADCSSPSVTSQAEPEVSSGSREMTPLADPKVWRSIIVSDLSAAEELLDWAELEGYQERELIVLGNATFLVRWRMANGVA